MRQKNIISEIIRFFHFHYLPSHPFESEISVFVFPNLQRNKIVMKKEFDVPALSLHQLVADRTEFSDGASCTLRLEGQFSANLIAEWLRCCLPRY